VAVISATHGNDDWLDMAVRLFSTGSQRQTWCHMRKDRERENSTNSIKTLPALQCQFCQTLNCLRQLKRKLWFRAFPLLHGVVLWMFNTVGEPPPDVNARVLVSVHPNP